MPEHNEYYLVVNGAHEADIITDLDGKVLSSGDPGSSPNTYDEWIEGLEADADNDGKPYQVYVIHHGDHELSDECECAQFETDHNPIWSRNA